MRWCLPWLLILGTLLKGCQPAISSARIQCRYAFYSTPNLILDPTCASIDTPTSSWSHPSSSWSYNPLFQCCAPSASLSTNTSLTLSTTVDLSSQALAIDNDHPRLQLDLSYYYSDMTPIHHALTLSLSFLDAAATSLSTIDLLPESDSLLPFAFDGLSMDPVPIPALARSVVLLITLDKDHPSFCFDHFALQFVQVQGIPGWIPILDYTLIGLSALLTINAAMIPGILFQGLPAWLWQSAPVNFFQKNPVVDHYVPLALFISTCQWIYNILYLFLASHSNVLHSTKALWLIPLVFVGVFFGAAFAHWGLFLCYNHLGQTSSTATGRRHPALMARQWRAPWLGLWGGFCLLLARTSLVLWAVARGSFWSLPIGILMAVPETVAMISVEVFFVKTLSRRMAQARRRKQQRNKGDQKSFSGITGNSGSSTTKEDAMAGFEWEQDLVSLSSVHHQAYVRSLLVPEQHLQDAAGSMYGRSTLGSDKGIAGGQQHQGTLDPVRNKPSFLGSTLNTTVSMASSSATDYTRHPSEYEYEFNRSAPSSPGSHLPPTNNQPFVFRSTGQNNNSNKNPRPPLSSSSSSFMSPPHQQIRRPPLYKNKYSNREDTNANKLTWNSATTSYTTTSAALPMTGAAPTPSAWEYVVYPKRYLWPSVVGTYLLIVRLPLRILVAVMTTMVLCFDVLLTMGAAATVWAVPVSCLLGATAYPGGNGQLDNTMNVARAMHTVNLVLMIVLLPAGMGITVLHQIRMVQKYNWCLRLLRLGNYGFVPGGREYKQHLKHPVRFIGYTVGFGVVGLCFTLFVLLTLCTIVALLLIAATFRSSLFRSLGSRALAAFGISAGLILILWLVQMLVIRYRFRMPGSRFLISHPRSVSFHHWEFFWAFFNIVFGACSFIKRVLLTVLSASVYSARMDLCIMGGRFRPWDGGFSAFVGLVLADHVHNNPVVLEFVQILRDLLLRRRYPWIEKRFLLDPPFQRSGGGGGGGGGGYYDDEEQDFEDDENSQKARKSKLLMGSPIQKDPQRFPVYPMRMRALNDIDEEGKEAEMEDLVKRHPPEDSSSGLGMKSGAVIPKVSKIHHYFRLDPRVERRPPAVDTSAATTTATPALVVSTPGGGKKGGAAAGAALHIQIQPPALNQPDLASPSSSSAPTAVTEEQIRQKLSEAKLRSIRVRNRWWLYVTLNRNPTLCSMRRTRNKDFLHPMAMAQPRRGGRGGHGRSGAGRGGRNGGEGGGAVPSHEEEELEDIHWDRED